VPQSKIGRVMDGAKAHLIKARADFADLWRLEKLI